MPPGVELRLAIAFTGWKYDAPLGDDEEGPADPTPKRTPGMMPTSIGLTFTVDGEAHAMLAQLNGFFSIVERMSAVDTRGVEPLYTPLSAVQAVALRLREDAVTETDQRALNQRSAPQLEDGLFLVPKVIE